MNNLTIRILSGLPACGKSYFAQEQKQNNKFVYIIDCDSFMLKNDLKNGISRELCNLNLFYNKLREQTIILDGLFLRQEQIIDVLNIIKKQYSKFKCIIDYWETTYSSRRICLANDNGRRDINSVNTIKNAIVDEFNTDEIFDATGINVVLKKHIVKAKSEYKYFVDKIELVYAKQNKTRYNVNQKYLYSDDWIVSVSHPDLVSINAEDTIPSDFIELDEILEESVPNITYLQYKRLKRECVTVENFDESDYYCGTTYKARYVCDLEKLYEFIKHM